ncbi:MAG: hypothetical protein AAF401_16510 [Pseudomonadota bacterium]
MRETRIAAPLLAILSAWLIHWAGGFPLLAVLTIALAFYAWNARPARNNVAVLDLIAGQWLALWALSGGLWFAGVAGHKFPWPGWIGGWILFEVLLWRLASRPAFWREMAAGAGSAVLVLLTAGVSHGWF